MSAASADPTRSFQFQRVMPVLEISDIALSLVFYEGKLGFDAATWGEPPSFAIVQRGEVTLALALVAAGTVTVSRKTWAAYIYVRDVDSLFAELQAAGVVIADPPENRPYNCREMIVDDPDGHILAFGQVLDPDTRGPGLSERIGRDARPGD
jgi:uncharacterized glyoxalase superfamily protein PhnB